MIFFAKFLIFGAFIAVTNSRFLPEENNLELQEDKNCTCDWRYFRHYEAKSCVVDITDSCGCPQKFTCPSNQTQQTSVKVCTYQNKEYEVGSKIISSDICQVCRCRDGVSPYISCVTRECPEIETSGQHCHFIYQENKCCPVGIKCSENETETTSNKTCEYNGRLYPFGSKIYPVDDPCQVCICDENWNGDDNSSCYQQECMFEKNKFKLDAGCIPVYHESRCCPVEFYCPSSHNFSYSDIFSYNKSSENANVSYDDQCTFAGQSFDLGEELFIDNPCVKCTCAVPPDFTCIHQTCPPPPNEEICDATYNSGECCPTYECMLGDAVSYPDCPTPVCSDTSCKIEVPFGQRCPTCVCIGCPTPICADSSCRIETPPGHECPTCVCEDNTSELEHNNLEQVSQQVSQNIEQQYEQVHSIFEPRETSDDYFEEELQVMPIRMQDSEGQAPVLEKLLAPELDNIDQYPDGLRELEGESFEDNYNVEGVNNILEENEAVETNFTFLPELELSESISNQSEKVFQKRSDVSDAANGNQTKITQQEFNGDLEREGGDSDRKNTEFDDELENFRNRIFAQNKTIINEIISINHLVKVPPGCPTPMCEGPWCKIGIPPGEKCPTCICKRHIGSEP